MNKIKSFISLVLCIVICMFALPAVSAAATPKIIISNATGLPGETVTVNVSITNNPGIMAMTFSVTYDKDNLEFVDYTKGFMVSPTYKDHNDKGYVAFSFAGNSESTTNGVIVSLNFKLKKDATPGKYAINIGNHNYEKNGNDLSNCFSNGKEKYIVPNTKAGSITVDQTCEEAGHNFGGWITTKDATCTETGLKKHTCARCGFSEEEIILNSHNFEQEWIVDKVATPEEDGIMSRHCISCDAITDKITFSYEEIGGDDTDDTSSEESANDTDSSSEGESFEDVSSGDETLSEDSSESNTSSDTQTENTSNTTSGKKPVINNTEGAKNPLSEVEKLENYKDILADNESNSSENSTQSEAVTSEIISSTSDDSNSSSAIGSNGTTENDKSSESFFATPLGIIIIIICILLSVGIIALGIMLIRRNKEE